MKFVLSFVHLKSNPRGITPSDFFHFLNKRIKNNKTSATTLVQDQVN